MNNILKFGIVLFLVNLVAASILTGVYYVTKPRIEEQERSIRENALRQVMPEEIGDRIEAVEDNGEIKYWKVFKDVGTKPTGYIFIAAKYGYSSVIETMVGIRRDGEITGVRVLSQNETPGLGAKIVEIVSDKTIGKALRQIFLREKVEEKELLPYFTEQLKGLGVRDIRIAEGSVEAITGATISSRACIDSIREKGLEIINAE